jgi:hypothetical protein
MSSAEYSAEYSAVCLSQPLFLCIKARTARYKVLSQKEQQPLLKGLSSKDKQFSNT